MLSCWSLKQAVRTTNLGGIIAYPTESVYGLGCDPLNRNAVAKLLRIKCRPVSKGMILVGSDITQIFPFVDIEALDDEVLDLLDEQWPGPVSFILPAAPSAPKWITGRHTSIAVRISAHPVVQQLCNTLDYAIVSTSANYSGSTPAKTAFQVQQKLKGSVDYTINAPVGSLLSPTPIIDPIRNITIRA